MILFASLALIVGDTRAAETQRPSGEWIRIGGTDGVALFRHALPQSAQPELQARGTVEAPPARVYEVVSDYDHFADFVPAVAQSLTLVRRGTSRQVFQRLDLPWPVDERAYVIDVRDALDGAVRGVYRVRWNLDAAARRRYIRPGTVVPRVFAGSWELRPAPSGDGTAAVYTVRFDPGGIVPGWLADFAAKRLLPGVFRAVRARAEGRARPGSPRLESHGGH